LAQQGTSTSALTALPAREALARFRQRSLSPVDLVDATIARIERLNPKINAITATCFDRARSEAVASEARWARGEPLGPLDGLTLGVKDLQPTAGLRTTWGSPIWRDHVPQVDLPLVAGLRRAGAIVVGKTNVPEHGAGGNSRNPVWGATGNPFDADRLAGGSSGGSAAALAGDLVSLATGSDTGGSLRLPAALCGVVGFRPSPGLVPHPTRPLGWSSISVLGPMARDMGDLVLMLGSCIATDDADPLNRGVSTAGFTDLTPAPLSALRIGYSEDLGGAPVDPMVREAFRARIAALAPQVAECRPVDLALGDMDRCFDVLRAESFLAGFQTIFERSPEALGEDIRTNVEIGLRMTLADRAWAHAEHTRLWRAWAARLDGLDAIVAPTVPVSPFAWTQGSPAAIAGVDMDVYYRWLALTYRSTLFGAPVLTLPCGRDAAGFPFGLQVMGRANADATLLRAGTALEAWFESEPAWRRPLPDLAALAAPTVAFDAIVTHPPCADTSPLAGTVAARTAV
jgi:Asp-tRNA(Asn)/Glu-tRNA(Gln) amidotransferase A subunit family amidase